jgi:hypothetical protein
MAEYGIPAPKGGLYDEGATSNQTTGPMDASDLNAPNNPFADRVKVHKLIINRIGGDPSALRPKNSARQIEQMLPQLFQQFFQRQGYVPGPDTLLRPEEAKAWEAYVANIYKNAENQETEKQKAIQKSYDTMAKQADADRKQYNALYWKTHPSEAQLIQAREKAMGQARQAAVDDMKFMENKITGGYDVTGPDGKPKHLTPEEGIALFRQKQAEYYKKIAPVYGVKIPADGSNNVEAVKGWLSKNGDKPLDWIGRGLKGVDEKTRNEVLASMPPGMRNVVKEVIDGQFGDTARLKSTTLRDAANAPDLSAKPDKKSIGGIPKTWLDALSGRAKEEDTGEGPNATPPKDREPMSFASALLGQLVNVVGGPEHNVAKLIDEQILNRANANPPAGDEGAMLQGMASEDGSPLPNRTQRDPMEQAAMEGMGMTGTEGPDTGYASPLKMLNNVWDWFTRPRVMPNSADIPADEKQLAINGQSAVYAHDPITGTFTYRPPAQVMNPQNFEQVPQSNIAAGPGQGYDPTGFQMPGRSTDIPSFGGGGTAIPEMDTSPADAGSTPWYAPDPDAAYI